MKFGIYHLNYNLDRAALAILEKKYGTEISILSFYRAWNDCKIEDDLPWLSWLLSAPKEILLTWEPWSINSEFGVLEKQPHFSLINITAGVFDTYIRAFASTLAACPKAILLRPMHEMNGSWYPWGGTVNNNTPEEFLKAWNHIRTLFFEVGASNVKWVWSPYTSSYPDTHENRICNYFPGDDQIDMIALDGYNWGASTEWSNWHSFVDLFRDGYDIVTSLSRRPVIIGEVGCAELGGEKPDWISDMFSILPSRFERIEALIWFDINKECDWRIASSASSMRIFKSRSHMFFASCASCPIK
ncbi:hypothetical protein F6V30_12595 [Oryzomonas sagensis]|uniref:GH26 domain-containing protein n=1 Tax=Oryzomonas sagensis TaxID=2603857 RepID=A0ABQ6TME8_9BACT|nr:glycosyl hydrolase [Oryzomonas sagensis]KAB0669634.1 hypothetical protein F6V30_12595 [Oryzomonas sagensis]